MNTLQETTEKTLADALALHAKGVPLLSIKQTYPDFATEIEDMLATASLVKSNKETIKVPEEGLRAILSEINPITPVTEQPIASPYSKWMITSSTWKFALPLLLLIVVSGGFLIRGSGTTAEPDPTTVALAPASTTVAPDTTARTATPSTLSAPMNLKAVAIAPAEKSKNVQSVVAAFTTTTAAESQVGSSVAREGDAEKKAVTSDTAAISDADTIYEPK